MNSEERVLAALRALADDDGGVEARPEIEACVRAAFRSRQSQRVWRRNAFWLAAAACFGAAAMSLYFTTRSAPAVRRPAVIAVEAPRPVVVEPPVRSDIAPAAPRRARRVTAPQPAPREIVTQFYALAEAAPPLESGQLVRVTVPASTMHSVGLPVREDRWTEPVQADILIGQEGIARAIRFVRFEQ